MNEVNEADVDLLLEQADALLDIKRVKEALALLHQAAGRAPEDSTVLCTLSYAYLMGRQWDEALKYGNEAVLADPDEERGHRLCSIALRCKGNPFESLRAAHEAVRLHTENTQGLHTLARAQLGCRYFAEAEATTWRLIELDPEDADSYDLLADINYGQERWIRMEWSARKALEIDPLHTDALQSLAIAVAKQKSERHALPYYVRILETDPTNQLAQKNIVAAVSVFPLWAMTALIPTLSIAMMALGMNGFAALGVGFAGSVALLALVFRFFPQALLYPQPACWRLSASHRAFVARTWQQDWLQRSAATTFLSCVYLVAIAVILLIVVARLL